MFRNAPTQPLILNGVKFPLDHPSQGFGPSLNWTGVFLHQTSGFETVYCYPGCTLLDPPSPKRSRSRNLLGPGRVGPAGGSDPSSHPLGHLENHPPGSERPSRDDVIKMGALKKDLELPENSKTLYKRSRPVHSLGREVSPGSRWRMLAMKNEWPQPESRRARPRTPHANSHGPPLLRPRLEETSRSFLHSPWHENTVKTWKSALLRDPNMAKYVKQSNTYITI